MIASWQAAVVLRVSESAFWPRVLPVVLILIIIISGVNLSQDVPV
jgi:hypothetical protein